MNKRHETRAYEVRAAESPLVIEGTAIVFDQPANMHSFSERIARSALDHVDLNDITLLVNHDGTGMEVSRESGFTSGLIDFRALCIADGKPIVPSAFVKLEVTAA